MDFSNFWNRTIQGMGTLDCRHIPARNLCIKRIDMEYGLPPINKTRAHTEHNKEQRSSTKMLSLQFHSAFPFRKINNPSPCLTDQTIIAFGSRSLISPKSLISTAHGSFRQEKPLAAISLLDSIADFLE